MSINPTSKTSLKSQCLLASGGNVKLANELYDYFIKDLEDLPMSDPIPPSGMSRIGGAINNSLGWISENKDQLMEIANVVRMVLPKRGGVPPTPTISTPPEVPLNPIN